MSKVKTQKISIAFERNGSNFGLSKDILHHEFDYELPEDFSTGVHIIGARTGDSISYSDKDKRAAGSEPTGWEPMVANIVEHKDIEMMVGKVLTIIDATISDKDQKTAFKSLVKQAIYGQYNDIIERSAQNVRATSYPLYCLDNE